MYCQKDLAWGLPVAAAAAGSDEQAGEARPAAAAAADKRRGGEQYRPCLLLHYEGQRDGKVPLLVLLVCFVDGVEGLVGDY